MYSAGGVSNTILAGNHSDDANKKQINAGDRTGVVPHVDAGGSSGVHAEASVSGSNKSVSSSKNSPWRQQGDSDGTLPPPALSALPAIGVKH